MAWLGLLPQFLDSKRPGLTGLEQKHPALSHMALVSPHPAKYIQMCRDWKHGKMSLHGPVAKWTNLFLSLAGWKCIHTSSSTHTVNDFLFEVLLFLSIKSVHFYLQTAGNKALSLVSIGVAANLLATWHIMVHLTSLYWSALLRDVKGFRLWITSCHFCQECNSHLIFAKVWQETVKKNKRWKLWNGFVD